MISAPQPRSKKQKVFNQPQPSFITQAPQIGTFPKKNLSLVSTSNSFFHNFSQGIGSYYGGITNFLSSAFFQSSTKRIALNVTQSNVQENVEVIHTEKVSTLPKEEVKVLVEEEECCSITEKLVINNDMDIDEAGPDNEEGQINSKKLERSLDTIVQNQNDFYDKENKNNYNLNSNNINNSNNKNKKFMASSAIITSSFRNENINLDHQKINKLESINTFNCKKFEVKNINAVNNWTLNNIANFENIESFNFIRNLHNLNQINLSKRAPVLPKKTRSSHPITLVLDLDETLVHCSTTQMDSPDLEFNVNFNGVDYLVKGKVRPYYKEFLERASEMFEIVIFTASQKVYADSLLNILDPNRKLIRHRLFRDSCSHIYGNYLKDLSILGRDLSKCVIVDNSPQAFGFHLPNGIPISSWYEDKEDTELLKLLHFLEKIREAEDVRPFVVNEFRMEERIFG